MKTEKDTKFKRGNPGGPGRPKGSRNAIQEDFLKDIHEAWKAHGKEVIASTVEEKPAEFLKVVASLLPKEATLTVEHSFLDYLKAVNEPKPASDRPTPKLEAEPGSIRH